MAKFFYPITYKTKYRVSPIVGGSEILEIGRVLKLFCWNVEKCKKL